jgi:hypothetical protein
LTAIDEGVVKAEKQSRVATPIDSGAAQKGDPLTSQTEETIALTIKDKP